MEMPQSRTSGSKDAAGAAEKSVTNLRTTNLTNLSEDEVWIAPSPRPRYTNLIGKDTSPGVAAVPCIHDTSADVCAVCSGYARWLIEDEGRLRRAQADPAGLRREFWRAAQGAN